MRGYLIKPPYPTSYLGPGGLKLDPYTSEAGTLLTQLTQLLYTFSLWVPYGTNQSYRAGNTWGEEVSGFDKYITAFANIKSVLSSVFELLKSLSRLMIMMMMVVLFEKGLLM